MIEYRVVQDFADTKEFEAKVNKALAQGWTLQGGVCAARDGMYQAMARPHPRTGSGAERGAH